MFCPRFYPAGFNSSKWFIYFVLSTSKIQNIFYMCKFSIRFFHLFSQKNNLFLLPATKPYSPIVSFFPAVIAVSPERIRSGANPHRAETGRGVA